MPGDQVILCARCGTQNRVPVAARLALARCGRCGVPLAPAVRTGRSGGRMFGWLFCILIAAGGLVGYIVYRHDPIAPGDVPRAEQSAPAAPAFDAPPVPTSTGLVRVRPGRQRIAPLEIRTAVGSNYFVKLVNIADSREEIVAYIEGGQNFTTEVPLGTYELRYAAGEVWYGEQHLFGPETAYSAAEQQFVFYEQGNSVQGYTIELILQVHGNLRTRRIAPSQF